jgi:uncharacterized protein with gpF-like domain
VTFVHTAHDREPPPDRQKQAAEATALALLLSGRRYSLPALIRQQKVNPRPFRQIAPTEALRSTMAAPYFDIAKAWEAQRGALIEIYTRARISGSAAQLKAEIDRVAAHVLGQQPAAIRRLNAALADLEQWHRVQWVSRVKSSTGLDVSLLTAPDDVRAETANAATWGKQLIESVHGDTSTKVTAAFLAALAAVKPASEAQADLGVVITATRKRAARIGVDQTDRTSAAFDRARRSAAGLARFKWHHTPQKHPRDDHRARDNRVYREDRAPNDRAGTLPFCKCWEEPLFD